MKIKDNPELLALLQKQVQAQLAEFEANEGKGSLLDYINQYEDTGGYMMHEVHLHVEKLNDAYYAENREGIKEYAADVINCCFMLLANRKLI